MDLFRLIDVMFLFNIKDSCQKIWPINEIKLWLFEWKILVGYLFDMWSLFSVICLYCCYPNSSGSVFRLFTVVILKLTVVHGIFPLVLFIPQKASLIVNCALFPWNTRGMHLEINTSQIDILLRCSGECAWYFFFFSSKAGRCRKVDLNFLVFSFLFFSTMRCLLMLGELF